MNKGQGLIGDKLDLYDIFNKIAKGFMPRGARLDSPGSLHHVIVRSIEKRRIVDDDKDRKMFVERLGQLSQSIHTAVYA